MYAIPNKTQHKLIAKVRGGISQKIDNFTSNINSKNGDTSGSDNNSGFSASKARSSITSPFNAKPSNVESSLSRNIDDGGFNAELNYLPQPIFHSIPEKIGNKPRLAQHQRGQKQSSITPEHNEMIKYVQQSWKGVERDYKKSVSSYINNIDMSSVKKKTATTSTPLLLSGSYHHSSGQKPDHFQPFDLEAFWGNRILKRLTEEL